MRTRRHRSRPHRIEMKLHDLRQLWDPMDPSPEHRKDLANAAEAFIVEWADELPRRDPVHLVIHFEVPPRDTAARDTTEKAVRFFFLEKARLNQLQFKRLMRQGRASLLIGLLFLTACLTLGEFVFAGSAASPEFLVREGLTIVGWVAMWRPLEIYLYDWWPLLRTGQIYKKLGRLTVEFRHQP